MKKILSLPDSIKFAATESVVKRAPKLVEQKTIVATNVAYVNNIDERMAIAVATGDVQTALWPAIASHFADFAFGWDNAATGTDKERAKILSKNARAAILPEYNKARDSKGRIPDDRVAVTKLPDTIGSYIATLARAHVIGIKPVSEFTSEGLPISIVGWTAFLTMIKEAIGSKDKEDAATCLRRLCKAYETHAGSRIPAGTVAALDVLPILTAMANALTLGNLRTLLDQLVPQAQQDAIPLAVAEVAAPVTRKAELVAQRKAETELATAHQA